MAPLRFNFQCSFVYVSRKGGCIVSINAHLPINGQTAPSTYTYQMHGTRTYVGRHCFNESSTVAIFLVSGMRVETDGMLSSSKGSVCIHSAYILH